MYFMSQKEIKRYNVINLVIQKVKTIEDAAEELNLSTRQILRLKKGVMEQGVSAIIHKNRGKQPARTFKDDFKQKIVNLKLSEKYSEANFQHYQELLEEHEDIRISYSALHTLMTENNIKSPKKKRKKKSHHRRKRKPCVGDLIQIDASPDKWFSNEEYSLHGSIDDATGQVTGLYFAKNECLLGYFKVMEQTITNFGIPTSIYADRHSIFRSPKEDRIPIEEQLKGKMANKTQFGRAMEELNVTIIPARSPQAKGRIERLWQTLQSRLKVELKVRNITTVEKANEFLLGFIPKFNQQFAVKPESNTNMFRTLPEDIVLDHTLCIKLERIVDNGGVVSLKSKKFLVATNDIYLASGTKLEILISHKFELRAKYKEHVFEMIRFISPKKQKKEAINNPKSKAHVVPDEHPFKYGKMPPVPPYEGYGEILSMLNDIFLKSPEDLAKYIS